MLEYYMFNKPRGCISARRDPRHKTVMDYFPEDKRNDLFHVGRLDKDTEGLMIVTNDGNLCFELMKPEHRVEKTYFFFAKGILTEEQISEIEGGVSIYSDRDFETAPAKILLDKTTTLGEIKDMLGKSEAKTLKKRALTPVTSGFITITEGKKHQVKRMIGYSGCKVVYLKRVKIGKLELDSGLLPGEYRPLTEEELFALRK